MNTIIKKIVLISGSIITIGSYAAATVQELLAQQNAIISLLSEYWIDKEGNVRIGDKNETLQFGFNKNLIDKMTDEQLRTTMNVALKRFTEQQQAAFRDLVVPQLDQLRDNKKMIDDERKKMETAATAIGQAVGKTAQEIMKLPDQNIKVLISTLENQAKKVDAYQQFSIFAPLRKQFNIAIVEVVPLELTPSKLSKETSAAKEKVAQGIANTNFKVSSMFGFIGTATQYSLCADRHFDIVPDSLGLEFISIAK